MASLELPSGIKILNPKPVGEYDEFKGVDIDTAKANALAGIPSALRYKGMKVTLVPDTGGVEYWAFIDGILDIDFVNIAEYYNNLPLIDNGLTYDVLSNTIKLGGELIDPSTQINFFNKIFSISGDADSTLEFTSGTVNLSATEFKIESSNVSANLSRPIHLHSGEDFSDSGTSDTFHFPLSIYNNSGKQRLLSEESFSSIYSYILSGVAYKGTWDALMNLVNNTTESLTVADSSNKGYYYVVNVAGTTDIDGITDWEVGDWIISNGSVWQKVDNTDAISSFNGSLGAITYTPQGTTNRITVTGASGLTPTFDIASTYAGQTSITTLGTIGTGTWQGTAIADSYIASATTWNNKVSGSSLATNYLPKWSGTQLVNTPIYSENNIGFYGKLALPIYTDTATANGLLDESIQNTAPVANIGIGYFKKNSRIFLLGSGSSNGQFLSKKADRSDSYWYYVSSTTFFLKDPFGVDLGGGVVDGTTPFSDYFYGADVLLKVIITAGGLGVGEYYVVIQSSNVSNIHTIKANSNFTLSIVSGKLQIVSTSGNTHIFVYPEVGSNYVYNANQAYFNLTYSEDRTISYYKNLTPTIAGDSRSAAVAGAGTIRYNNGRLEFSNGTDWNETSSFEPNIRTVTTGTGTVASGDYIIRVTTTSTVLTLPLISAVGIGKVYKVFSRNVPIQINVSGSDLIDGQVSYSGTGYTCVTLRALGTNDWSIGD